MSLKDILFAALSFGCAMLAGYGFLNGMSSWGWAVFFAVMIASLIS